MNMHAVPCRDISQITKQSTEPAWACLESMAPLLLELMIKSLLEGSGERSQGNGKKKSVKKSAKSMAIGREKGGSRLPKKNITSDGQLQKA